ncbi:hypothetical protein HAX54_048992 [Datura stramonium]|uniref:Uncharacterized protein n=1 Tax=Datura stramonium TaxID=4076 RepID=A0ABS8WK07_DATST|nr:hypothetical protein [Datura stramonium]
MERSIKIEEDGGFWWCSAAGWLEYRVRWRGTREREIGGPGRGCSAVFSAFMLGERLAAKSLAGREAARVFHVVEGEWCEGGLAERRSRWLSDDARNRGRSGIGY